MFVSVLNYRPKIAISAMEIAVQVFNPNLFLTNIIKMYASHNHYLNTGNLRIQVMSYIWPVFE